MAQSIDSASFNESVLKSDVPVLVDFWAPWCGPCRVAGPIIDRVGEKAGNRAKVYKLNIDENPATANEFGVTAIPTVVVFRDGKVDKTLVGVQREQAYLDALAI